MAGGKLPGVRSLVAAMALVAVGTSAGCSSSGGAGGHSSGPATTPAGTPTTTPAASTSAPGSPTSPSGTAPDAATRKAITSAFTVLFGNTSTTPQDIAVLQHGAVFRKTIDEQGKSSYADKSSAKVTDVRVHGDVADVTFTILDNGKPLLQGYQGNAVREGGHWKVAAKTFCGLLQLEGDAPSACSDPSIIALPH